MTLYEIITAQLDDMLKRGRLGSKWSITKEHIIGLAKSEGIIATRKDVAKAVKELPYRFLMKKTSGYCFPASAQEWKEYTTGKEKIARGLLREAIDEGSWNYNEFNNTSKKQICG